MSSLPDRREFLRTAGLIGVTFTSPLAASPVPGSKAAGDSIALPPETEPALPSGATVRLGSRRMRVNKYIHGYRFSPTGKTLVAADRDTIWGWDTKTARVVFRFKYPEGNVSDGALTSQDTLVLLVRASGAKEAEYQLRHYEFATGSVKSSSSITLPNTNGLTIGPDALLICQNTGGNLRTLDGVTGKELWTAKSEGDGTVFFGSGKRIVFRTEAGFQVADARTGDKIATLAARGQPGQAANLPLGSTDGKWLAALADRNQETVSVWDVATTQVVHTIRTQGKPLLFHPNGEHLITASSEGVTVWNLKTGQKVRELDLGAPTDIQASPDGTLLAARGGDAIWFYDAATGNLLPHSADPPGLANPLWFTSTGKLVGQLGTWGGWVHWDPATGQSQLKRSPGTGRTVLAGLSADGSTGLYRDEKTGIYQVRNVASGKVTVSVKPPKDQTADAWIATPDGSRIVELSGSTATVIDARNGKRKEIILERVGEGKQATNKIRTDVLGVAPSGRSAAVVLDQSTNQESQRVLLLDLVTNAPVRQFQVDGRVGKLYFSQDGQRIAVALDRYGRNGENQNSVVLFDSSQPHPISRIAADAENRSTTSTAAFSPDARTLARPTPGDKGITLWEVATGKARLKYAFDGEVTALAYQQDGRILAASCSIGPVILWDVLGDRTTPATPPDAVTLDKAWQALEGSDAEAAFRAIQLLARFPDRTVPFLDEKITPAPPADRARVKKLIDDLNSDAFRIRDQAQRELARMVEWASGDMKQALDADPPPEVRQRLEDLLQRADQMSPPRLRWVRAVEVLEWASTPEANRLLTKWASGGYGARLTSEAKRSAERLVR